MIRPFLDQSKRWLPCTPLRRRQSDDFRISQLPKTARRTAPASTLGVVWPKDLPSSQPAAAPVTAKESISSTPPLSRGYDHEVYRDKVRRFQITPHIARRCTGHGSGLGVYRWGVEGAIALLHWFRRLRICWEIRDDIHHAFVTLGCAVICWRRLRTALCRE